MSLHWLILSDRLILLIGKSKGKKNEKLPQSPEGVSFHPAYVIFRCNCWYLTGHRLQSLPTSSISITEESDVSQRSVQSLMMTHFSCRWNLSLVKHSFSIKAINRSLLLLLSPQGEEIFGEAQSTGNLIIVSSVAMAHRNIPSL